MVIPEQCILQITVFSKAPSVALTATTDAVRAALLSGLDVLAPGWMSPHEIGVAAQKIETKRLGQQWGIQDQIWWELERRLVLIYLEK